MTATAALAAAFQAVSRACVSAATVSATTLGLGDRRTLTQETVEDLSRRGGVGGQHGDIHSGRWEEGCVDVGEVVSGPDREKRVPGQTTRDGYAENAKDFIALHSSA